MGRNTVPDTFALSHINYTSCLASAVKVFKYDAMVHLPIGPILTPIAVEAAGSWNAQDIEFIHQRTTRDCIFFKGCGGVR